MKKIVFAVLLSLLISAPAFAEETKKEEMPAVTMNTPMGMTMSSGMGKMSCPMMGKAQMVATDEGGVIVLVGKKLLKYDADLNLVKEVELPMPVGGKQCPMMGTMAGKDSAPAASGSQEKTA